MDTFRLQRLYITWVVSKSGRAKRRRGTVRMELAPLAPSAPPLKREMMEMQESTIPIVSDPESPRKILAGEWL
jgi:hypothetical protein